MFIINGMPDAAHKTLRGYVWNGKHKNAPSNSNDCDGELKGHVVDLTWLHKLTSDC